MKKIIIILFWLINISLNATKWYVAPDGNDSNNGDIDHPWKTWGKAFNWEAISAGDTVYFRGGVYMKNIAEGDNDWYYPTRGEHGSGYGITRDGTITDTLCYFAYPGEVPILDCYNADPSYRLNFGIRAVNVNYVKFKGLVIKNVREYGGDNDVNGVSIHGNNIVIENCTFSHIWGHGLAVYGNAGSNIYVINCDAHHCCDSLSTSQPGNDGTGFMNFGSGNVYYKDCRAWLCGDQGFSTAVLGEAGAAQYSEYDGCWGFNNGMLEGFGHAFKMGWIQSTDGNLKRLYKNCIAAYNRHHAWKTNDAGGSSSNSNYAVYVHFYNNIAYHNGYGAFSGITGFQIMNTKDTDANELKRILKNNISYDNEGGAVSITTGALYTHDHNTWDIPLTITDADFLSVDSTGITASRQADGSLPDNDCYNKFLRLSSTSLAYQAGVDVGLTYDAVDSLWRDPPSIGAYEYYSQETPEEPAVLSEITTFRPYWQTETTAISGGNVFDDGGADVAARGVCWSTSPLPTIADEHTTDGTGTGVFYSEMTGLNQNWVYYIRAYATNEVGTAYGNQMTFRENQILRVGNKILRLIDGRIMIIQ